MKNSILTRLFVPLLRIARSAKPVLACFVGFMGIFLSAPHLAQAVPTIGTTTFPVSGGFTTINQSSGGSRISLNFSGFSFFGVSTGNIAISQASSAVNLLVTPTGATPVYLGFASDDGSNFKLSSFFFRATNATYATTLTLTGYSNGSAVSGATSTLAVTSFGVGNHFTWDVSAITAFQNIDEVRITGPTTGTGGVALLSITLQTAVTPAVAPTVTTPTSASIAATTATLGGNVTSDGGATITERGVVFSLTATNGNPLINGSGVVKTPASGGTTGVFTVPVSSLTAGSGYSYKAYATNSVNTSYSPVSTFTTLSNNADLSALALTTATINETFAANTTSYTSSVPNTTSSVTVTPTRAQANATIEARVGANAFASVTSGTPSSSLALAEGANTINVRVTAQDGTT